tara:strand:+ start:782 stop:1234 length:453 start_codon:yes stop_codon:yes gene_type:complete
MTATSIKQFKLTNEEEIICEVVEWDNEENHQLIIRGALKILQIEDFMRGVRFFAFRPWMLMNDNPEDLHTLSALHIIGETTPDETTLKKYASMIVGMRKDKRKKITIPLDETPDKLLEMSDAEFDKYMKKLTMDSDMPDNVIPFKPTTVH